MKKSIWVKLFGLLFLLLFISGPAFGTEKELNTAQANIGEEPPSMELLEFLGDWETDDNKWVDPVEFDSVTQPEHDDEPEEE